jgi:hypothetical protein
MIEGLSHEDANNPEVFRQMMGPAAADQSLRQAVQMCWMTLPPERRTLDALEKEVRFLIDRIFRDMREDAARVGSCPPTPPSD